MKTYLKDGLKMLYRFVTNRLLWLFVILAVLFYILLARLFELQIVLTDSYQAAPPRTRKVEMPIQALRGTIYDRAGRPLAVNELAYVVKIDPSVTPAITNEGLYQLALLFERNNEDFVDELPITKAEPYAFTFADNESRERNEIHWKREMTVENAKTGLTPENATAQGTFDHLREQFGIDDSHPALPNAEVRKILNLRCLLYLERMIFMDDYDPDPITLAYDVGPSTVAAIEERNDLFTGVYIEIQPLREYPQGIYFSHMLGYIRKISAEELEANKDNGYTSQDLYGKSGLERSQEGRLRGTDGSQTFEVDSAGRRNETTDEIIEPIPGDRIFLTTDLRLQKKAYELLEEHLSQALIAKLTRRDSARQAWEKPYTLKQVFTSLINSNNLDIEGIMASEEGGEAYVLREYILERFPEASALNAENEAQIKSLLTEGLDAGRISPATIILSMIGVGQLTDPGGEVSLRLKDRAGNALGVVIDKIKARELTPQMINMNPSTGSVVVVDVRNGDVLAAMGYPSYDNNRFVNNFDNDYYYRLYDDPTNPTIQRPFSEPRAPGSTFKMVSAVTALESGVISPTTTVYDEHSFKKAGEPFTDCWSARSHGSINVTQALQVSCNYFFCEVAYRLGNARNNSTMAGIATLNDYMAFFGLNEKTGVEIGEYFDMYDDYPDLDLRVSSPEFKEFIEKSRDEFAPRLQWEWRDGDTVTSAMGQSYNNYTPAMMARYVSVVANRGVRYPLHLLDTVESYRGETVWEHVAVPDTDTNVTVSENTWDAVIEGMRLVTEGTGARNGTAVNDFKGFPIRVAGKTGTAEQIKGQNDHSSFAAFAPLENPQIAVYVSVPFGDTSAYSHVSARIAREMIGETLGLNVQPERPIAANTLSR